MQGLRLLLLPLNLIYGCIVLIKNALYSFGIKKSYPIPGKSICIGNITVGGTGKSPLTKEIARLLQEDQQPVILSRGYGRASKGLQIANSNSTASLLGDEPMMYWSYFQQQIPVVVAEERKIGVDWIRKNYSESVILLDDAFQHRAVKAGLNIVLMTFDRPTFKDFTFPAGNLREFRSGIKRADLVVVTKCPENLSDTDKKRFFDRIPLPQSSIYFSRIQYGDPIPIGESVWKDFEHIVLITAIAQPEPLRAHFAKHHEVTLLQYPDHHAFTAKDIESIQQKVATFADRQCAVITTEKDLVKLSYWLPELFAASTNVFVQTIAPVLDRQNDFNKRIKEYVVISNERSS